MKISGACIGVLLAATAYAGQACEMPPLMVIPSAHEAAARLEQLRAEFQAYYQGMQEYTACVQAELASAGGDDAPASVKAVLVQRNNSAVAEVQAMMRLYETNVTPASVPAGPAAAPPAEQPREGRRGRNRN
jgi:hypothetical protein